MVFYFDVYVLLDPSANFYFVIPYLAIRFDVSPKIILEPFLIYTPYCYLILSKKAYKNYCMLVLHNVVPCDLFDLVITSSYIIL